MVDKEQLKTQGVALGRHLQMAFKMASMYSVDHPAAEKAVQQAYASLNSLVKQTREFTIGFMDNRLLLNTILTDDDVLG